MSKWMVVLVTAALLSSGSASGIKIGILCNTSPSSWQYLFGVASAMNIAQDKLIESGIIQNDTISSIIWRNTIGPSDGLGNLVDLVLNENVDVIFGSPSSFVTETVAHLTSHWNIPQLPWGGKSYGLSDKVRYPTVVRTEGPLSSIGDALHIFFRKNNWSKIGLIYYDKIPGLCQISATGIKAAFGRNNITIMQSIGYPKNTILTNELMDRYLGLVKRSSRIIFLCADNDDMRRFLVRTCKTGMCNGNYLFISIKSTGDLDYNWQVGDEDDEIAKLAFKHLLIVSVAEWKNEIGRQRLESFQADVIDRMIEPPWYNDYAKRNNITTIAGTQALYESTYLYGLWLNYSSVNGLNWRDGAAMLDFSRNKSFESISMQCDIGMNGDKVPQYWFQQFQGEDAHFVIVAISENKNKEITDIADFQWMTNDGLPPKDMPACGFFGELCNNIIPKDNTEVIVIATLTTAVAITCLILVATLIRKRKLDEELIQSVWKINLSDIEVQKTKMGLGSRISNRSSAFSAETENGTHGHGSPSTTTVAIFKGQTVALRNIKVPDVVTIADMTDLKTMRELMHDNVNAFIGACFDQPSPCLLFQYCAKGSLQDILENDEIKLDSNFKNSLTMDLVQGLLYIHNSKLGSHGRLKSTNCLVDNRWMLKVTDYGLSKFLDKTCSDLDEPHQKFKNLLWTAPEILNADTVQPKGTKEGDVYSFGVILHEVFYRMGPFAGNEHLTVKEIIQKVKNQEARPCRPEISNDTSMPEVTPAVVKLMKLCWHDEQSERPTFSNIRTYIKKNIQLGGTVNIVDVILQRLETYASNLEDLVDQRTRQLTQEKQKSDKLLYRMLPRPCAEKLKLGDHVMPEIFESATVFFSDIVGFTTISAKSTPIQVVDLLNDLYICFDDIINTYDAYKVETIGDAYLVVSGIPSRNGNLHVGIIADLSLDIIYKVQQFKIQHLPQEDVRVRIGCHTGTCCAGIVGLSMPRYCLFGDTVNTASRMESNGEAQKVHISKDTHLALQDLGGYVTSFRGEMDIKGKGLMKTYWLDRKVDTHETIHITSDSTILTIKETQF